jgi:hypothetical protein
MNVERIQKALASALTGFNATSRSGAMEELTTAVQGLLPKFDQVAFYVPSIEDAKRNYRILGCTEWTDDVVTAVGTVGKEKDCTNVARLAFNYQLNTELELIRYSAGRNWHQEANGRPHVGEDGSCAAAFMSHMSYHVENMYDEVSRLTKFGFKVVQDVKTISHTNQYLLSTGRKYNYVIFDTRAMLGFDLKLIKRLESKEQ